MGRRDTSLTSSEIDALLSRPVTMVLVTLGRDGRPHPTAMWFVPEPGGVLMWTYAKSQKARNLRRDPRCALLVEEGDSYFELRGASIQARADLIEEADAVEDIGVALYQRYTYPQVQIPVERGPLTEIRKQAAKRVGLRLTFEHVASWDHAKL